jgi:hypothetical protein
MRQGRFANRPYGTGEAPVPKIHQDFPFVAKLRLANALLLKLHL